MGIQNMVGNFSGIAAPILTGIVVDWSGSFAGAFLGAAALSAVGVLAWSLVVQKIHPVDWAPPPIAVTPQQTPVLA
jgi:dipeptide/tripeptide permease